MVVTRFAPAPTGFMHVGNARTALFNYLFAKHYHGRFLLRIEDTDHQRYNNDAVEKIFSILNWLDLKWDGDVIFQSTRSSIYQNIAMNLLNNGMAYYCFASQDEISSQRQDALSKKQHFIFRSKWRNLDSQCYPTNIQPVIRFKTPRTGQTVINDLLQGNVTIQNTNIDDAVLLRSDGTATYILANLVDDIESGITHVIRGDDHLTNTAKQMLLYHALNKSIPKVIHIPLIHDQDGGKLSKRHGAPSIDFYKNSGYMPEAIFNYLLKLGWGYKNKEIFTKIEAIELFDIHGLGKAPARFDIKKLNSLNAYYIKNKDDETLTSFVITTLSKTYKINKYDEIRIMRAMRLLKIRAHLLTELIELSKIFIEDIKLPIATISIIDNTEYYKQLSDFLKFRAIFNAMSIKSAVETVICAYNLTLKEFIPQIRILITGLRESPNIFEMMEILGKNIAINRLNTYN